MGAIGNYEIITQAFTLAPVANVTVIQVDVPQGKVALGWGVQQTGQVDGAGNPITAFNSDLVVLGYPTSDGTSVTFQFYEAQGGASSSRTVGTLYVTCAEMGC